MVLSNRDEYIKKYWNDFYNQPDIKIPRRDFEMKIGLPRCNDKTETKAEQIDILRRKLRDAFTSQR